mgnify:CR=1 FL=1
MRVFGLAVAGWLAAAAASGALALAGQSQQDGSSQAGGHLVQLPPPVHHLFSKLIFYIHGVTPKWLLVGSKSTQPTSGPHHNETHAWLASAPNSLVCPGSGSVSM